MADEVLTMPLVSQHRRDQLNAASRRWRERNPDKARASKRAWYHTNTDRVRDYNLRRNRGISQGEYLQLLDSQGGVCAICCGPPRGNGRNGKSLQVDHDHATNKVRGLLCSPCNTALGLLGDNPAVIMRALAYLEDACRCEREKAAG